MLEFHIIDCLSCPNFTVVKRVRHFHGLASSKFLHSKIFRVAGPGIQRERIHFCTIGRLDILVATFLRSELISIRR